MIHIYITQLGNYLLENLVLNIVHITEITPEMLLDMLFFFTINTLFCKYQTR